MTNLKIIRNIVAVSAAVGALTGGAFAVADEDTKEPLRASALERSNVPGPPESARSRLDDLAHHARDARSPMPDKAGALAVAEGRGRTTRVDHPSGRQFFVTRAGRTMCLIEDGESTSGMSCGPTPEAMDASRPPITVTTLDDGWRVTVLVPDGTSEVTVTTRGGRKMGLAIADNIASGDVPQTPSNVGWTDATGVQRSQRVLAHE